MNLAQGKAMFFNFKKNYFIQIISLALLSVLFLSACNYSHKFTAYMEPQIVSNYESERLVNEIGVLFVIDVSGSMNVETKYLSQNISKLASLFKGNYSNYSFGITVLKNYNKHDPFSDILYTFPENFHNNICDFKAETVQGFIRESKIGSFFRFSSEDITKYDPANLFCILSKSINTGLPTMLSRSPNSAQYKNKTRGDIGVQSEYYFLPIQKALERLTPFQNDIAFQNFFGRNSYLTVIFISDAEGDGYSALLKERKIQNYDTESVISAKYANDFYNEITSYKQSSKFSRFYGVIPVSIKEDCDGQHSYEAQVFPPHHVLHLIKKTQGKFFPICDTEWGSHMDIISEDLDSFLQKNHFLLERIPKLDTVEVFYDGVKVENNVETGWYYNPETISINVNPNVFNSNSKKSKFTLAIRYYPVNSELFFQEE